MNFLLDSIENSGTKPILDLLKEFGGWPLIDDSFDEDNVNLTFLLIKLKTYQVKGFFHLALNRDADDDQRENIFVSLYASCLHKCKRPYMYKVLRNG